MNWIIHILKKDTDDEVRVSKVVMTIGGRRYEMVHTISSREITRGPADVIEMPENRKEKQRDEDN